MQAGRELDALVAEKVMGFTVEWAPDPYRFPERHAWIAPPSLDQSQVEVPRYSTDIAAAWQVVEHMSDGSLPSFAEWRERMGGLALYRLDRQEAAHAICIAALRAVGVNV